MDTKSKINLIKSGFIQGIGWSFGVTFGFLIISTLMVIVLNALGGMPLIGNFIAGIVRVTQENLVNKTPMINP